jgi:hypothetical protein
VVEPPPEAARNVIEKQLSRIGVKYRKKRLSGKLAGALKGTAAVERETDKEFAVLSKQYDVFDAASASSFAGKLGKIEKAGAAEALFEKVNWDEIIPDPLMASADFNNIYSNTTFKKSLKVANLDTDGEYELLLFGKGRGSNRANVVLMVEDEGDTFRQASWSDEGQRYISKREAMRVAMGVVHKEAAASLSKYNFFRRRLMRNKLRKQLKLNRSARNWKARLVWEKEYQRSRFQPVYEVATPFGATVFVRQDGSYFVEGEIDLPLGKTSSGTTAKGNAVGSFGEQALASFPLLTVAAYDPGNAERRGVPRKGEVWIRIKPAHARKTEDIMAGVAALYKETENYTDSVTVRLWVGGRVLRSASF